MLRNDRQRVSDIDTGGCGDGKIATQKDNLSAEEVQYTYDTLNRLIAASTTAASDAAGVSWGQSYGFDGFGNLMTKSVTKGAGPTLSMSADGATNRLYGGGVTLQNYDANGNLTVLPNGSPAGYDAENRLISTNVSQYGYDAGNQRIWKWAGGTDANASYWATGRSASNPNGVEVYFYGVDGKRLGTYVTNISYVATQYLGGTITGPALTDSSPDVKIYFLSKLVAGGSYTDSQNSVLTPVVLDRLGSGAKTFPYGEEKVPNGVDGIKFATYTRETATNLDYAVNRYYANQWGRFTTPDPYVGTGGVGNPGSWNRYGYVEGDPVNHVDPTGQMAEATCFFEDMCVDVFRPRAWEDLGWSEWWNTHVLAPDGFGFLRNIQKSGAPHTNVGFSTSLQLP